jgi:iron-sulfur cluster insertion protein
MPESPVAETARPVTLSESAARQISEIMSAAENRGMMLRVAVSGGGCSGFQYGFTLDDTVQADDHVVERDGVKVLIDDTSWGFLAGAEIHYDEGLIGAAFKVRNPNATSTCGCGTSFAV